MRNPELYLAERGWWKISTPQADTKVIPFLRVVGSVREWTNRVISDRQFSRALRKAAAEVDAAEADRGG
jgi:hypothetical protein